MLSLFVLVAQLNRATGCGPVGRGFESLRARHTPSISPNVSLKIKAQIL